MEMRRYQRLNVSLAVKYQAGLRESEKSWSGEGLLQNISLGGIYFTCEASLLLEPGQVHNFSIAASTPGDKLRLASRLAARGVVMRVEPPAAGSSACGVAVKFLTPLQFCSP